MRAESFVLKPYLSVEVYHSFEVKGFPMLVKGRDIKRSGQ